MTDVEVLITAIDKPGTYSPRWKHHLQQMVVAKKPLKYLAEHIDLVSVRVEA